MLDLLVGQSRVELTAPVDEASISVNETLLEHADESLNDSRIADFIKGEGKTLPIDRDTHAAELIIDFAAIFLFPVPNALNEILSTEIMSCQLLSFPELLFHNTLSGDTGVIAARQPKSLVS